MDEASAIEHIVAAILTNSAMDRNAHSPDQVVRKYRAVLKELQDTEGSKRAEAKK